MRNPISLLSIRSGLSPVGTLGALYSGKFSYGVLVVREEQVKLVAPSQRPASNPDRQRYEPDGVYPLLPKQYFQIVTGRKLPDGEKRLMLAVLEEAIRSSNDLAPDVEAKLKSAVESFASSFA